MGHRAWSKEYAARRARREVERDEDLKAEVTVKYETWESEGCEISHVGIKFRNLGIEEFKDGRALPSKSGFLFKSVNCENR
jgi:hypothetical protein